MSELRFEWDDAKNRESRRKHGVPFEEAQTVFLDENAIRFSILTTPRTKTAS